MSVIGAAEIAILPQTAQFASSLKDKITDALKNPAVVAGAAITAVGGTVEEFSRRSIDRFQAVAGEVSGLSRQMGVGAEAASRFRFAAQETGVSTDSLSAGIRRLSTDVSSNSKALSDNGIKYKDARGQVLPMDQLLGNVADKFAALPNGVQKNTLAIQLFGKAGGDLVPLLNKGRDGLAAYGKEADKFGLTLTQNNLDAIKKNALAHKEFSAAVEGLQVQLGSRLLPVATQIFTFFSSHAIPIIADLTSVVQTRLGPIIAAAITLVSSVFDTARTVISNFWATFQAGTQSASGVGLVSIKSIYDAVFDVGVIFRTVSDFISTTVAPVFSRVFSAAEGAVSSFGSTVLKDLGEGASLVLRSVVDYVRDHIPTIKDKFNDAKGAIQAVVEYVKQHLPEAKAKFDEIRDDVQPVFSTLYDAFLKVRDTIKDDVLPKIGELAATLRDVLKPAVEEVTSKFLDLAPTVQGVSVLGFAALALSAGDVVEALGAIKETAIIGAIFRALSIEVGAFSLSMFGAEIAIGAFTIPAELVIAAIAGIVAGLIYAYTHFEVFRNVIDTVARFIRDEVFPVIGLAVAYLVEQFGHFVAFIEEIWPRIQTIITAVAIAIGAVIYAFVETALFIWHHFGSEITTVVVAAFELIHTYIETVVAVIRDVIKFFLDFVTLHWATAFKDLLSVVNDVFSGIGKALSIALGALIDIIKSQVSKIRAAVGNLFQAIYDEALALPGQMIHIGEDIIKGLINGIKNVDILGVIKGIGSSMENALKGVLRIHSPSLVFQEIGENVGLGLISGINSMKPSVDDATMRLVGLPSTGRFSPESSGTAGHTFILNNYGPTDAKSLMQEFQDMQRLAVPIR